MIIKYKVNEGFLAGISDLLPRRSKKYIISKYTAAEVWGFSPFLMTKLCLTVPKGYNPNKSKDYEITTKVISKFENDMIKVTFEGREFRIYSPEKTLVEIVKSLKNEYNDQNLELIQMFFKKVKYDKKKLFEIAKEENALEAIAAFQVVYG